MSASISAGHIGSIMAKKYGIAGADCRADALAPAKAYAEILKGGLKNEPTQRQR